MKEAQTTKISTIELSDTNYKMQIYINKIMEDTGPAGKMEKLCHLASETFSKCAESEDFSRENYQRIKNNISIKRNYYLLYLMDLLLKSSRYIIKAAKKDIQSMFRSVWVTVWNEPKNTIKVENLKAMVRTWGIIYGPKLQESIRKWLETEYRTNLKLSDKNEELLKQNYQHHKNNEKGSNYGQLIASLEKQGNQKPSKKSESDKNLLQALDL